MYTSLLSVAAGGNWNDDSAAFLRTSSHVTSKYDFICKKCYFSFIFQVKDLWINCFLMFYLIKG